MLCQVDGSVLSNIFDIQSYVCLLFVILALTGALWIGFNRETRISLARVIGCVYRILLNQESILEMPHEYTV